MKILFFYIQYADCTYMLTLIDIENNITIFNPPVLFLFLFFFFLLFFLFFSFTGAFWNSSDPFSKKKQKLSDEENLALELIDQGKKEILALHTLNRNYLDEVEKAAASDKCRDKLWVCMEIPKSSKCSHFFHWFALIMTLLSILLFLVETMPDFNEYRENGRVCREVVKHHCDKIYNKYYDHPTKELKNEAFMANLGCFSSEFQWNELNISYPIFSDAADKLQQIWAKCYVSDYTKEFFMAELGPIFLYI